MKATRKELRKLIESVFVSSPDGTLYSPDDVRAAKESGEEKDAQALGKNPKLDALLQSDDIENIRMGRNLATTLGYQPELSDIETLAVDDLDPKLVATSIDDSYTISKDVSDRKIHHDIMQQFRKYLESDHALNRVKTLAADAVKYPQHYRSASPEISWIFSFINSERGFNLSARLEPHVGRDEGGYIKRWHRRELAPMLEKMAEEKFNDEYIDILRREMKGEKFPLTITESQIRKLIRESLDEGSRIIVDPEGEAFVASDAYQSGTAKDAQTTHPKLMNLRQSGLEGQRQARQLAVDLDMQPELTAGEETAVEMGKQKAMAPDLKFHNELPGTKSIELSKHIKSVCKKRGFICSVKDLRHKGYIRSHGPIVIPFIKMFIEGKHPLRRKVINAEVFISDSWMGSVEIQMRAYHQDGTATSGVLTNRNTAPYLSGAPGYGGLEALADLVVDAISEL